MSTDNRPLGLVPPHPDRKPHPCNGMRAEVHCGDGAYMSIKDPTADTGIGWTLRYGDPEVVRYVAAGVLDSYDYLLSDEITATEAIRRLRLLRAARRALLGRSSNQ